MNMFLAAVCIVLFSLTVPFTRMAALEIPPEAIIFLRLIGAGLICVTLAAIDGWIPPKKAWAGILGTAFGSVLGFSSFTAFAMKLVPSGHAAVALAAMPIVTAAYAVLRDRAIPGLRFWFFAVAGTVLSFSYFLGGDLSGLSKGDLFLILAILSAAFGYVEGGRASRIFSGQRIMSWAVIVTLPLMIPLAIFYYQSTELHFTDLTVSSWLAVSYLAWISQSFGMFLWFRVLAIGPMEKIALVQLLQPFLTLLGSILLLGETVAASAWLVAALVGLCIFGANQERRKGKAA